MGYALRKRNTSLRDLHRAALRLGEPPCAICGEPIDYTLKYPHPRSFVADHIVPLDAGGADALENKQSVHAECNRVKSNKGFAPEIIRRSGALVRPTS